MCPRSLPLLVALLLCVTAVVAVAPVDARAPPTPVCGVCELDHTTADGRSVVAGESSLTVTVHGNGSTTWDARVDLASGGDALAANESLRRVVVSDTVGNGIAKPRDVDARVDGDTLAVTYRDPNATERHLGVVTFTPLTPAAPRIPIVIGGEGSRYLAADRLTVRGEPDWSVRGDAPAEGPDGGLVWTPEAVDRESTDRVRLAVDRDPAAVADDSLLPGVRTWIARLLTGNGI